MLYLYIPFPTIIDYWQVTLLYKISNNYEYLCYDKYIECINIKYYTHAYVPFALNQNKHTYRGTQLHTHTQ